MTTTQKEADRFIKRESTIETLRTCFLAAKEAGLAAAGSDEDGGTSNLDSPAFRIPRMKDELIQEAAQRAGVTCSPFQWFGGNRWYWLSGFITGQGNRRCRISSAADKALRETAARLMPEMKVCEYCQMD